MCAGFITEFMCTGILWAGPFFYGRGAGSRPAASSVAGDIIDVARNITHNCVNRVPIYVPDETIKGLRDISEIENPLLPSAFGGG